MIKRFIVALLLCIGAEVIQAQDASTLLNTINQKFKQVNNYSANVQVTTTISFAKIAPQTATIYYQQPDRIKIKSKSIMLLPKQGFDKILKIIANTAAYTVIDQGKVELAGKPVHLVSILPLADTSDIVLAKLWIDAQKGLITQSQTTTKSNGTITAVYTYGNWTRYALPESIVFSIDVKKYKIPKALAADINNYKKSNEKASNKGTITLQFSNYLVNKQLPANIFK